VQKQIAKHDKESVSQGDSQLLPREIKT
jgi:hypothetical protein